MALLAGTRLGPYEILSPLGAGGMGEVYRARDTRLDRTVAIKVLPAELAADREFRERFDREARAISRLDHPHICALFDVGEERPSESAAPVSFLVLQYLEGQTLADRIVRGALPLADALTAGIQIADALDAAHRAGIVHRDLKPGNVMLTATGAKLLDFGLASARGTVLAGPGLSMLPTTPPNLTAQGTVLGTVQYMAPEQLEGKDADARTDIFALGATLFEMLTGKKAFSGPSQASVISSIMASQPPPVSTLQALAPPALDHLLARCLAKDADARWQSVRDVKLQLEWIAGGGAASSTSPTVAIRSGRERVAWMLAAAATVGLLAIAAWLAMRPAPPVVQEPAQFSILPPDEATFATARVAPAGPAISPDGRHIVFTAARAGQSPMLWLRSLASLTPTPLAGTEFGTAPFWSPDSRSIAFFALGKLKTLDVAGGPIQTLADAPFPLGGTWNSDGVIVFAPSLSSPLLRVSASGSAPPIVVPGQPERVAVHVAPFFLPDGRHFLFSVMPGPTSGSTYVGSIDSPDFKLVVANRTRAVYSPADPGYLVFTSDATLMAQPFDASRLAVTGDAVPIADRVAEAVSVSRNGVLIYQPRIVQQTEVVWVDRKGQTLEVAGSAGMYSTIAFAPDDRRAAFARSTGPDRPADLWIADLQRRTPSRFTFQSLSVAPIWSPDGQTVVFVRRGTSGFDLYQRPSNASAPDELLLTLNAPPPLLPSDWSRDGAWLAYFRGDPKTQIDLWVLPLTGDRQPRPLLRTEFNESQAQFSPDGKWIAYVSDESGSPQIYVQSFPALTAKRQISPDGGTQPRWRRDGKELFYLTPDQKLTAVTVTTGSTLEFDAPRPLFDTRLDLTELRQAYAVAADGQRFLLNLPVEGASPPLTAVLNWTALLRK